jgi:hypothetical protein
MAHDEARDIPGNVDHGTEKWSMKLMMSRSVVLSSIDAARIGNGHAFVPTHR